MNNKNLVTIKIIEYRFHHQNFRINKSLFDSRSIDIVISFEISDPLTVEIMEFTKAFITHEGRIHRHSITFSYD